MTKPGKVLVLGAGGLLGRALCAACAARGIPFAGRTRDACDISSRADVTAAVSIERPALIVNAAAATDVDRCEAEPGYAYRANALGPRLLALAAREHRARLVHVSTDYVFDGELERGAYTELDRPSPRSTYARSKLAGEEAVLSLLPDAVVARSAWVFGPEGKNFVSKIPGLLAERGALSVVSDQWSSPTSAADLAEWLLDEAPRAAGGVYHVVNAGQVSYLDVARVAATLLQFDPDRVLTPIAAADVPRPAPRPRRSPLASVAIPAEGLRELRPFEAAFQDAFTLWHHG